MRSEPRVTSDNDDVNELTEQVVALRVQGRALEQQLQTDRVPILAPTQPIQNTPRNHRIGDRVIITNNYRNLKGIEGRITNITRTGTWIDIETDEGKLIRKHRSNLKRVQE